MTTSLPKNTLNRIKLKALNQASYILFKSLGLLTFAGIMLSGVTAKAALLVMVRLVN